MCFCILQESRFPLGDTGLNSRSEVV